MLKIDVVIVNWNAGDYLRKCLTSLIDAAVEVPALVASITVVDNGSTDGSLDNLPQTTAMPIRYIVNADNRGFAAACNQGAKVGCGNLILFLNPDAAVSAETLAATANYMGRREHIKVGICGVRLFDDDGRTSRSCSRFPSLRVYLTDALGLDRFFPGRFLPQAMSDWPHDTTRQVDQIMGAYFCIRRLLFHMLNGFDERFFVYSEEVDLSYRAVRMGYVSMYLADVSAYHKGGGSSDKVKARRLFYYLRSRLLYSYKHFMPASAVVFSVATLVLEPVARLAHTTLVLRSWSGVKETIKAFAYLWFWFLQYLLRGRSR